ncbi:MAG: hypothetical protein Q8M02_08805 [Candidatus Didemnitutus sp.]|nr:hypothetical protein [Candidatus Didemnitutus sp.]
MSKRDGWWLVLVLSFTLLVASLHSWIVANHANFVSQAKRANIQISLPYELIRPEFTVDGHMWIRYAVHAQGADELRVRRTELDNAPQGREVHWNTGFVWWIAGWGQAWHKITGEPLTRATEQAAMWSNLSLLMLFAVGMSWWAVRRSGLVAGAVVALAFVGHRSLYEGFWPGYADHHGLTIAALVGMGLGAYFMRGGWILAGPRDGKRLARSAARWSGFWGAFALWVSAASAVPAIAVVALAALVASVVGRAQMRVAGAEFDKQVWRSWGRTGALVSLGFYLLEYFPGHLGWRLEVNHPLYALAWLAGGEILARLMPVLFGLSQYLDSGKNRLGLTVLWALPLAAAPALAIVAFGPKVFMLRDPFLVGLHETITEFLPLGLRYTAEGIWSHYDTFILWPALYLGAVTAMVLLPRADRWALIFALCMAMPLHALGFWQSRWAMNAAPGHTLLLIAVLTMLLRVEWVAKSRVRALVTAVVFLSALLGPSLYLRGKEGLVYARQKGITAGDARQLVYREVAQTIRESQPEGEVVLLASPNTSVNVAFFGDFKSLGTLYWENLAGLKAAAAINAAPTDEAAAALIRKHGVTHLAFLRDGNYIVEYARLLHPDLRDDQITQTFGYRLLAGRQVPVWLEALPYAAPTGLPEEVDREMLLFRVNFEQKPTAAAYRLAMLQMARNEIQDALNTFAIALQFDPQNYPAHLRRGELFLNRQQWPEAVTEFERGAQAAPVTERYRVLAQAGIEFERLMRRAEAAALYERALREQVTNVIAGNNLAWIFSTTPEAALRNPARALELAHEASELEPKNMAVWGTLAAAYAANGDFTAALAALDRAEQLLDPRMPAEFREKIAERRVAYTAKQLWLQP